MSIPLLHSIFINGAELQACLACAMGIATSEPDASPATPGCDVCSPTMPPDADVESDMEHYIGVIKKSGTFKATLYHLASHMNLNVG